MTIPLANNKGNFDVFTDTGVDVHEHTISYNQTDTHMW